MRVLTDYEAKQLKQIRDWQEESPGWGTRLLAKPGGKIAGAVQALVPEDALRAALDGVNRVAEKLSDDRSILKRAKLDSLEALRTVELEVCDRLMRVEQRRAMALAGVGGAAFGVAGAAGMVADVPALIALALRTIHRVGLCYGEDLRKPQHRKLAIGVFALVSANSLEEKRTAVAALRDFHPRSLDQAAWRDGVERAAERELAKEAAVFSLQNLARKLGINLGQRKAAGAVPVLGALIGGSVNAWYLYDIARVSRYVFQERWLAERHSHAALSAARVESVPFIETSSGRA
ncbi:MAG: EcsC family protein [Panacagrimonas sp.]